MTTDGCMAKSIADCEHFEFCKGLMPEDPHPCEIETAVAREALMDKIEALKAEEEMTEEKYPTYIGICGVIRDHIAKEVRITDGESWIIFKDIDELHLHFNEKPVSFNLQDFTKATQEKVWGHPLTDGQFTLIGFNETVVVVLMRDHIVNVFPYIKKYLPTMDIKPLKEE